MSRHPDLPTITIPTQGTITHEPPSGRQKRFTSETQVIKRVFTLPEFNLESGCTLRDVKVGYETYGQLNDNKDNAILITHYFSGTSHAAGRYQKSDIEPGYWDSLIGPGKAIDTDRYFVIGVDCLSNINTGNPMVVTTGPLSINPITKRRYMADFPVVTIGDFVRCQYALCKFLGLQGLHAVAGPSMGAMQALEWAARFPQFVDRIVGVIGGGLKTEPYLIGLLRQWCSPIFLDPHFKNGFYDLKKPPLNGLAASLELVTLTALSPAWANRAFDHPSTKTSKAKPGYSRHQLSIDSIESALSMTARSRAEMADANSFLRIARAVQLFDVTPILNDLKAKILWITAKRDLLLFPEYAERGVLTLREREIQVETFELSSDGGHLDGISAIHQAGEVIQRFINQATFNTRQTRKPLPQHPAFKPKTPSIAPTANQGEVVP